MPQRAVKFIAIVFGLLGLLYILSKFDRRKFRRFFATKLRDEEVQGLFTWLGSGRAITLGVGNKGALLDEATRAGLPVPRGIVLLDGAWQQALQENLVVVERETVTVPDPRRLMAWLNLPPFSTPLAVRSAFSAEDGETMSLAGFFTSKLFVDPSDPAALAAALAEVWGSALKRPGCFRRDVLLMEMVEADQAGVAFTEREFEDDLVNYTGGTADKLVSGAVEGTSTLLPKLRNWEWYAIPVVETRTSPPPQNDAGPVETSTSTASNSKNSRFLDYPWVSRLQKLLRDARHEFGHDDWDIEWVDDGQRCWLVQIRPITRSSRRNEAFTSANMREILPSLPSRYTTTLIASCAEGLFAYYRSFDPKLPTHRPICEIFYDRPFFNISLLTEMMRRWGLPTQLVTGNIGGETDRAYGFNLWRFLSNTFILLRIGWAQFRAVSSAQRTISKVLARTQQIEPSFAACVELHRWLFTTLVTEMFSLTSAMSGPLQLLRSVGVLAEHNARQQTITTEMYTDLEPLRAMTVQYGQIRAALEKGELPADPDFRRYWQAYLDKHGHRGVYESDIARPRLHEAPEPMLVSLSQPANRRQPLPPRTLLGRLTLPIWWQASRNMQAREALRYNAIIGFDRLRRCFLALADQAVSKGLLPNRDSLWMLDIDEVRQLDHGWRPDADFFAKRQQEIERLEAYDLPDLFYRFDDLEQYKVETMQQGANAFNGKRVSGISLTTGEVHGRAWVLTEPSTSLPPDFTTEQTILVARSVDAGWIPTFGRVAGAIIEIGGDLSHGSIILREIGLPAITNVRGATRFVQTGDEIVLRAGSGVAERI